MTDTQGQVLNQPAAPQGQGDAQPAGVLPQQTGTLPAAIPAAQQGTQGEPPTAATPDPAQHFQSLYNQTLAEKYKLEDRLNQLQQQQVELMGRFQAPPQPAGNPYDPQTDQARWWAWEKQDIAKQAAENASRVTQETFGNVVQQAAEAQWTQAHPGVDVQAVKAYARMNGIAEWNLELSYRDMTRDQAFAGVATNASRQALNQFRQPNQGAVPIRASTAAGEPQYKYEDLLRQVAQNPNVVETWPKNLQEDFWKETTARQRMYGTAIKE